MWPVFLFLWIRPATHEMICCQPMYQQSSLQSSSYPILHARLEEGDYVQEASFRRHISMNCLISETSRGMMGRSKERIFCVVVARVQDDQLSMLKLFLVCRAEFSERHWPDASRLSDNLMPIGERHSGFETLKPNSPFSIPIFAWYPAKTIRLVLLIAYHNIPLH